MAADSPGNSLVNFAPYEMVLPYPFESVLHALRNKFKLPNDPLNPTIVEVRVVSEETVEAGSKLPLSSSPSSPQSQTTTSLPSSSSSSFLAEAAVLKGVEPGSAVTLRKREIVSTVRDWIPSLLRWAVRGVDTITAVEELALYPSQRMMRVRLTNRDLQSIGKLQDQALYRAHELVPEWTVYRSYMDVQGMSTLGNQLVNYFKPKAGQPPPSSAVLLEAHIKVLTARLRELCGQPVQPAGEVRPPLQVPDA